MSVPREDIFVIEKAGDKLFRLGHTKEGLSLLALALKYREELHGFSVRVPRRFACEIDESAGLAEVVNLEDRR